MESASLKISIPMKTKNKIRYSIAVVFSVLLLIGCTKDTKNTPALPSVTTSAASMPDPSTCILAGNVTNDGGDSVTERGICYSTSANPKITDTKIASGSGRGSFTATMNNLQPK